MRTMLALIVGVLLGGVLVGCASRSSSTEQVSTPAAQPMGSAAAGGTGARTAVSQSEAMARGYVSQLGEATAIVGRLTSGQRARELIGPLQESLGRLSGFTGELSRGGGLPAGAREAIVDANTLFDAAVARAMGSAEVAEVAGTVLQRAQLFRP